MLIPKCGEGEIRTHGPLSGTAVFKTAALGHYATPPGGEGGIRTLDTLTGMAH